jgi:NAD(P)-dependent dehydrogenase (short-subunit alcohol dehydrogenase family)
MNLAVISGASSGIGLATAHLFHQKGFRVINISRRNTAEDYILDLCCDLADPQAIAQIAPQLQKEMQRANTTCLVHNACLMLNDSLSSCDSDALRRVFEVNLIAPTTLNKLALPGMKSGSSILYLGSTLSEKAVANTFNYVVSKHAIAGMMRASCQDLVGTGIHTACICPGFTNTEMLRTHLDNDEDIIRQIAQLNSFKRLIKPEEIAELIVWAAMNPVITGSLLHAHLGQIEK